MLTRRILLMSLAASSFAGAVQAENAFPNRAIKIVVPFPPGTSSELVVRTIADRLTAKFGHPVVVENRPGGAGGTVGAAAVANAAPDGYTLLASPPGPLVTAAALYKGLSYDPSSLVPVALLFESPQLLVVHPNVPAGTPQELAQYARTNPGKVSYASPGYATQPHLLGEMFKAQARIDIVHVPYKGPANAVTDLLAGQVQMYFETSPLVLPLVQSGRLKLLATAGVHRAPQLPDVPTMVESGFADLVGGFWAGIVAPAGTPPAVVATLNTAINSVMQSNDVQAALAKLGALSRLGSPEDFRAFVIAENRKWSEVIKSAGLKAD